MNPWSTRVAPGPGWLSVNALLFQKMLLNSAVGLEKPGAPGGSMAWNSGSLASDANPAECGLPSELSDEDVETLLATVLLTIRTFEESSSMTAPPRSADPLSTIMLLRRLTVAVSASSTKTPPPSSP